MDKTRPITEVTGGVDGAWRGNARSGQLGLGRPDARDQAGLAVCPNANRVVRPTRAEEPIPGSKLTDFQVWMGGVTA